MAAIYTEVNSRFRLTGMVAAFRRIKDEICYSDSLRLIRYMKD